jgi:hypothetical protein
MIMDETANIGLVEETLPLLKQVLVPICSGASITS